MWVVYLKRKHWNMVIERNVFWNTFVLKVAELICVEEVQVSFNLGWPLCMKATPPVLQIYIFLNIRVFKWYKLDFWILNTFWENCKKATKFSSIFNLKLPKFCFLQRVLLILNCPALYSPVPLRLNNTFCFPSWFWTIISFQNGFDWFVFLHRVQR